MKIIQKVYRPGIDGPELATPAPRRDHGDPDALARDGYAIRVLDRGEQLSYIDAQLGEVVAEIFIPGSWIDADSIRLWDRARPVTDAQRAVILERVAAFWPRLVETPLQVIHGGRP